MYLVDLALGGLLLRCSEAIPPISWTVGTVSLLVQLGGCGQRAALLTPDVLDFDDLLHANPATRATVQEYLESVLILVGACQ